MTAIHRTRAVLLALGVALLAAPSAQAATGVIESVYPGGGPTTGGSNVLVDVDGDVDPTGTVYFGDTPGIDSKSYPNGTSCPAVDGSDCVPGVDGIFFTVKSPPGSLGTVDVSIRSADGTVVHGKTATADDFRYAAPIDPEAGRCGQQIAVTNPTTLPIDTVTVGGQPVPFTLEPSIIRFTPPAAPATGELVANGTVELGWVRGGCLYEFPSPYDQFTGIKQIRGSASGPTSGGNTIELWAYGPNSYGSYPAGSTVYFGSTPAVSTVITAEPCPATFPDCTPGETGWTVKAVAPPGAAGWTDLTIHEPDGTIVHGQTSGANDYLYVAPVVTNVPSISGIGGAGTTGLGGLVLVRGTKLAPVKALTVGSRQAIVLVSSSTLAFAFVPSLPAGSYPVKLVTKAGTATAPTKYSFK